MTSLHRHLLPLALLTILALTGAPAAAQSPDSEPESERSDEQVAADYYQEARQAYGEGQYDRAAELLDQAWQHDPEPVYRYNQILALQGAGDYETALELLDEHDRLLREEGGFDDIDEIRGELDEALADRKAPREEPADAETKRDIDEPEGVGTDDDGDLAAWSLVGTGGAAFATGLVVSSGILIDDTIDRLEESAAQGVDEVYGDGARDRDEDLSRLRTHRLLAAGLLVGGLALGTTGGVMLRSDGDGGTGDPDGQALRVRPTVDIDFAGAMLEGRF